MLADFATEADSVDGTPILPARHLTPHALNQVVLSLYREGRDLQLQNFQGWALEQVRSVIAFDSAWWGNAGMAPHRIHGSRLFNCDASMLRDYRAYMEGEEEGAGAGRLEGDFFRAALQANPGVCINLADLTARAPYLRTDFYRHVGKKFHMAWSLGTLLAEPNSSLSEFLTLWRHDGRDPFSEAERQAKQLLMPHLAQAFRAVRLRHFLNLKGTQPKIWALADDQGFIRELSPAFASVLRTHWPAWRGSLLPQTLAKCVVEGRAYNTKALVVEVRPNDNLRFLEVKPNSPLDRLSGRESEIAARYAAGETYSCISVALALSPATVRNHISHCFKKLGVTNKAELANLLSNKTRAAV